MPSKIRRLFQSKESRSQFPQSTAAGPSTLEPSTPQVFGPVSIAPNSNSSSARIGKGQNYGIQVLHDGGDKACIDIVFVHGLTGNAYDTWLHKETGVHWPSDLLKLDLPDTRILSFGYDADIVNFWKPASSSRLRSYAENLVGDLVRERGRTDTETRGIIFVAHSLGGLVTERALSVSRHAVEEHLHQVERNTIGLIFLGVPHCGADLASWGRFGAQMVNILKRANKDIVRGLEPGSEMLREVEKDFHSILRLRRDEGSQISITCFFEELAVAYVGMVVPLQSAEIKGYSCYGIHANHTDITKFPNQEHRGYDAILGELRRWKKTAKKAAMIDPGSDMVNRVQSIALAKSNDRQDPIRLNVPRVNPLYTGRKELGERLARVFSCDSSSPPPQQRVFVITGIGGTGKSEVCAKFADDHAKEYWGIFWLDGSSVATADQGLIDIGRQCGIAEPSRSTVMSWLVSKSQRWLLIIDNADNPGIDYSTFMPSNKTGDIILTSRNPECVAYKTEENEPLDSLDPQLARELLFKASATPRTQWKEKEKAATTVVESLGSHTLAIISAGAFFRRKLCSLEEYPIVFREQKKELLKFHSKTNVSTYGDVYKTFEVSACYFQDSGLPEDRDALNLLHILAFMHSSDISETVFERAAEYATKLQNTVLTKDDPEDDPEDVDPLSLSVDHITRLPQYMQRSWSSNVQNRLRWRRARAILESLSLVTICEANGSASISMHSLVHAWAKERQDPQDQRRAWQSAATILAMSCQGQLEFSYFFYHLQPHVRACVSHDIQEFTSSISATKAAQLLLQFAYVHYCTSDYRSLGALIQSLRVRLQDMNEIGPEIREEVNILRARVDTERGNHMDAIHLLKKVLTDQARRLARDHPDRLHTEHDLACVYRDNGQYDQAIELLEHIVKVRENLAGDHPDRLNSQYELACAYIQDRRIDKSIELLEHVVMIGQEKLTEDHPDRLRSELELIHAYKKVGKIDQAADLLGHMIKIEQKKLGGDHPNLLDSQIELIHAYKKAGQIDKSIESLELVIENLQSLTARDHGNPKFTDTMSSRRSSLPSLFDEGSSQSSQSSISSIADPLDTVQKMEMIFSQDEQFNSLCQIAIDSKKIDTQKFERNLARLIKDFAVDLGNEAAAHYRAGQLAAKQIRSLRRRLASQITQKLVPEDLASRFGQRFNLGDDRVAHTEVSERDRAREVEELLAPHHQMDLANDSSSDDDVSEDVDNDQEGTSEEYPNTVKLEKFILASNAFNKMRRGLRLFLQPDVFQTIAEKMKQELESPGHHTITFKVHWNLMSFCREELEGSQDLATLLTVTGTGKVAFATTCQDYVVRCWPNTGLEFLKFLESAICQQTHHAQLSPQLSISMDLKAWHSTLKDERAIFRASGPRNDLIHVAQQLAWISAVFRLPKYGDLSYSDVEFERTEALEFNLTLMDLQTVSKVAFSCWHPLFVNAVLARGFKTPHRGKQLGIEIPFEVMTALACILYPMEYHGGTILRGISRILVPTAHDFGSIQWHLIDDQQSPDSPRLEGTMKQIPEWFQTLNFELLRTARTFLGYCREAEIHLGTKDTDYSVQRSATTSERSRAELSRDITTNLGMSIHGYLTTALLPKITFQKGLRCTTNQSDIFFEDRLQRARDQPLLLYDADKKQGWLVPELSVVLHMAHAYAFQQPDISKEILKEVPHATASANGGEAAWSAISKGHEVEIRKVSLDGKPHTFGDVVRNMISALERIRQSALERDDASGIPIWKRRGLLGWEYADMVNLRYSSQRKEVKIDRKTAGRWDLIAAGNPDLVVVFCKGFMQPIRPADHERTCPLWTPVPEGHCYLIASIRCLKKLSEDCGGTETGPKLTRSLHWHRPQGSRLFENCNDGTTRGCNRLQELVVEKKAIAPGVLEPDGAVIFGKMSQKKTQCCETLETPITGITQGDAED